MNCAVSWTTFSATVIASRRRPARHSLNHRSPQPPTQQGRVAQIPGGELTMRIDRLEAQMRQLTGAIEQLQHRNQQLEAHLRRMRQEGTAARDPRPPRRRQQHRRRRARRRAGVATCRFLTKSERAGRAEVAR